MQYRGLNCEFNIEWHSISSGGKPTFPTCEFPSLEWYPRVIPFFTASAVGGLFRSFLLRRQLGVCVQIPQRKLVDGSDPLYFDLATQMLAQDNFVAPIRDDLNNPPTSVGGIHEAALLLVVDRI